jgi:hypothetical protein
VVNNGRKHTHTSHKEIIKEEEPNMFESHDQ